MYDVSAFTFTVNIVASNTFPNGFTVTAFADDSDPFDVAELTVAENAMGLNGDLIVWSKAEPIKPKIAVIHGSDADINLSILLEANRVGKGKFSARDVIQLVAVYPSGATATFAGGRIMKGTPSANVASAGKLKTKVFEFAFENKVGSGQ